jgi:hypothetical protein
VLLQKTFQLDWLFPREIRSRHRKAAIVVYDEDSNVIVATNIGNFMLELESMRFTTISKSKKCWSNDVSYPYRNFYTAGNTSFTSYVTRLILLSIFVCVCFIFVQFTKGRLDISGNFSFGDPMANWQCSFIYFTLLSSSRKET